MRSVYGILCLAILFLFLVFPAAAQNEHEVSGVVTSAEDGSTLPGANVLVKGTTRGTTTNQEGEYALSAPSPTDTLVFSFVGYLSQEIPIDGREEINVALQADVAGLEEMVVIGYGTVTRQDLTGSVSRVDAAKISNTAVSRVDQGLQGKSAGVRVTSLSAEPGSGTTIRVRGGNSISASNEPLYVIDGFIGGGDLNSINPSDIESIEILKDASATAIYGSQGANGVVLITTKQGTAGETRVNIRSSVGWQEMSNKFELLTGPELARYQNEASEVLGREAPFPDLSEANHYDWIDAVTQVGPRQNHNVSVSGGSESVRYFISGNYTDQEGIVKNSGFNRLQSRVNVNVEATEWLGVDTQLNLSRTNTRNNTVSMSQMLNTAQTYVPFYDEDGDYTAENPVTGLPLNNPIANYELPNNNTFRNRINGNISLSVNPLQAQDVELISRVGVDINANKQNIFQPSNLPLRQDEGRGAYGQVVHNNNWNILSETTISYRPIINDNNRFDILGGFTFQRFENEFTFASADDIPSNVLSFHGLDIGDPEQRGVNTGFSDWTLLSYFGRLNYTFKEKYLLTFTSRLDGSSRLAEENKWAIFPSVALAWQLGEEPFIQSLEVFDELKLRASYGRSGNQAIGIYESLPALLQGTTFLNEVEQVSFRQGRMANPNLKWETTQQFDAGLDAALSDRLSLTLDYYYKRTRDLLLEREIPTQTGFQSRLENIGQVQNQGLELSVDTRAIETGDFAWDFSFNIAGNRNKVLDLGGVDFIDVGDGSRLIVGEVGASFVGAVYEGTWKSQEELDRNPDFMPDAEPGMPRFRDVNGNGTFDGEGDFAILGNFQADFFGGFSNTIRYRGLTLNADIQYSYGNDIFNRQTERFFYGRWSTNLHAVARNRWTPDNPDSDIPRAGSEVVADFRMPTSAGVHDGSFLRLKNLRLEYAIPSGIFENLFGLNGQTMSVHFTGTNLLTLSNYDFGWDPEVSARGQDPVQQGFDSFTYPAARTYAIGFNYTF